MLLADVVAVSEAVRATRSRAAKIDAIARLLRGRTRDELNTLMAWFAGDLPQGKVGLAASAAHGAHANPAETPSLAVTDVDCAFDAIRDTPPGPGSKGAREELLLGVLMRATAAEQRFLKGLLAGELRQGALRGLLLDALARAARVPAGSVRRAAMLMDDLGAVALLAFRGGAPGLDAVQLTVFTPVEPMLAKAAETVEEALDRHPRALFDEKLDGVRIQVHRSGDRVRVFSRSLREITASLPDVVAFALGLPGDHFVLDGELLSFTPDGRPVGFGAAMERFGRGHEPKVVETVGRALTPVFFDCLASGGRSLLDEPTLARRRALEELVPSPRNRVSSLLTDDREAAEAFVQDLLDAGREGAMAKDPDATYTAGGRGWAWLKIKPTHTLDVVVLAAEWGNGRRKGLLSNLHLGVFDEATGEHVMLGKTFKGLTDEVLTWQTEQLLARETRRDASTVYVRPELVVEIAFHELMRSRRYAGGLALRFARVKGYRPDKRVDQADTLETARAIRSGVIRPRLRARPQAPAPPRVVVSSPERVVYPGAGFTKADVVEHYRRVGPRMLEHVRGRPLTLVRHPKGVDQKGFFQKNVGKHYPPWIPRVEVPRRGGATVHPAADHVDALAYFANQGAIEVHMPTARSPRLECPDRLVLDLDPPEGAAELARAAALHARALLDELGLPSTPLATGSKGYHVVVCVDPVDSRGLWRAAMQLGAMLVQRHPDVLTDAFLKAERGGRVLVDWMRSGGGATVVAPWSLRARPGAPVAVPIRWSEIGEVDPDHFRLDTLGDRWVQDPLLEAQEAPVDGALLKGRVAEAFDASGAVVRRQDRFGRDLA